MLALLLAAATARAETTERLFGIIPQYSPQESARQWQPLLDHLRTATGMPLRFATGSRISRFEERVFAGDYDFVYLDSTAASSAFSNPIARIRFWCGR